MVPRRGESEGSTYEIKSGPQAGKWRAAVVVGYKPNNKPDRRTALRATEVEAKRALRTLLNERDTGKTRRDPKSWKLGDWLEHWLVDLRQDDDLAISTREDYASLIRTWLDPVIGDVRLTAIDERHPRKLQAAMKAKGRSASRRHHAHVVLHSALNAAVRERLLGYNPIQHVTPPAVEHHEVVPPTRAEVEAIFDALKGQRDRARFEFALVHGVRQGEALGLEWSNVDLEAKTATVVRQLRRTKGQHGCGPATVEPVEGKRDRLVYPCGHRWASKCPDGTAGELVLIRLKSAKSRRTIGLTDDVADQLRELKALQKRERLMHGASYRTWRTDVDGRERDTDLVFRRDDGRPVDPRQDHAAWQAVLKLAGLGPSRLHNARHAAVVGMLDAGVPLAFISKLVGHASEAFTMTRYGHMSSETATAVQDAMTAHQRKRVTKKPATRRKRTRPAARPGAVQLGPAEPQD